MDKSECKVLVEAILSSSDIVTECGYVSNLLEHLQAQKQASLSLTAHNSVASSEDLEKSFLQKSQLTEPETSVFSFEVVGSKINLNSLILYLFKRRFGWSEQALEASDDKQHNHVYEFCSNQSEKSSCTSQASSKQKRRSDSLKFAEESKVKTTLNSELDGLIHLLTSAETLDNHLLEAYLHALHQATNLPVVRSQLYCHILGWLILSTSDEINIDQQAFELIKHIIVSGITDVWSAIRKNCVSRMTILLESFSLNRFKEIFQTLVKICDDNNSWQAKDGAIMAIGSILQCFKLAVVPKSLLLKSPDSSVNETIVCRRFGQHYFVSLPSYMTEKLQPVIYKLLASSQLSIKENANRAFSSFLLRSDFSQLLQSFKEVLVHLARKASCIKQQEGEGWKFVDANKVDGFIKAFEFVIRQLPAEYILKHWQLCFATFSHYLMHPASTVRQAASSVFKYMVTKHTSKLLLPKLVTRSLVSNWRTNIDNLKSPESSSNYHLQSQRSSIKSLGKCFKANVRITDLWEWREGRLLAYELILKFLITNHIHYTFPAYTLTRGMNATNTSCAEIRKGKNHNAHHKLSVSHNFGSEQNRNMFRHEGLSRSLTMECDPFTKRFVSSLAEKEQDSHQTFSLLGALRKLDKSLTDLNFENLYDVLPSDVFATIYVTEKSIEDLEGLCDEQTSANEFWSCKTEEISFGCILVQIFIQTVECVADPRWELRRMAYQVLPLISEAIRFYDTRILEVLWESHLSSASSQLGFAACISLRDSLSHAARLVKCFENPSGFWKDIDKCRFSAEKIVRNINDALPHLLVKVTNIVQRPCFDKLTIIAIEVLMLSAIHFSQESIDISSFSNAVRKLKVLFIHSYPENGFALHLKSNMDIGVFSTPKEGLLSCSTKGYVADITGKDVLDYFFIEIQRLLPLYVNKSSLENVVGLLPIILIEIESLTAASVDVQSLYQVCNSLLKDAENVVKNEKSCDVAGSLQIIQTTIHFASLEICNIIQKKNLKTHLLRQYLDLLLTMCKLLGRNSDLKSTFSAVSSMLNVGGSRMDARMDAVMGHYEMDEFNDDEMLRIRMLSNDIRQSPIDEPRIVGEDEQELADPRDLLESQALSKSNHQDNEEPRSLSPHQKAESSFTEEYDTDWDDWEDEDEDLERTNNVLGSFLNNLRALIDVHQNSDSSSIQQLHLQDGEGGKSFEKFIPSIAHRQQNFL